MREDKKDGMENCINCNRHLCGSLGPERDGGS